MPITVDGNTLISVNDNLGHLKIFPGGEVHVSGLHAGMMENYHSAIRADIRNSDDVMTLLMATDALKRAGVGSICLKLPYLPYARQDRVNAPGEALSVKVFCDMINAQNYSEVEIWDCHSDVGLACLTGCVVHVHQSEFVQRCIKILQQDNRGNVTLVAPDAGSLKKIYAVSKAVARPFIRADKHRDVQTGKITDTVVYCDDLGDTDLLIVDDICDGGFTFVELAKVLKTKTKGKIYLYVTHGIFSKGLGVFKGIIDGVFVANPFIEIPLKPGVISYSWVTANLYRIPSEHF